MKNPTLAVIKFNRDTKNNTMLWEETVGTPKSLRGEERLIGSAYKTQVNDRYIQLYQFENKYYFDEDSFTWSQYYRLEFVNIFGAPQWEFPNDNTVYDLFQAVQFQVAKIENFFDDYLKDEPDPINDLW